MKPAQVGVGVVVGIRQHFAPVQGAVGGQTMPALFPLGVIGAGQVKPAQFGSQQEAAVQPAVPHLILFETRAGRARRALGLVPVGHVRLAQKLGVVVGTGVVVPRQHNNREQPPTGQTRRSG